jgi:hypothetical protein
MRSALAIVLAAAALYGAQFAIRQNRWAKYEPEMQDPVDDPPDALEQTEFAFARLRFRSPRDRYFRRFARWGTDTNKSDRIFMQAIRRLTRVHTRSIEEVVDIDTDEMFNWPFLYAVGVGDWVLSNEQAARLREYFTRGGFLMVDDFHGTVEWNNFAAGMTKIFPDRDIVDIDNKDPIFHVVYDLDDRFQVPGMQYIFTRSLHEYDGFQAKWRGVYDDKGRVMVAIVIIWISVMPGRIPTTPGTPKSLRPWRTVSQ